MSRKSVTGAAAAAIVAAAGLPARAAVESQPAQVVVRVSGSAVRDAAPFARLEAHPREALVGSRVRFDASASSDLEGSALAARFDFEGDGRFDTEWGALVAEHAYTSAGSYAARVEVRDAAGGVGSAERSAVAAPEDLPPVVEVAIDAPPPAGETAPRFRVDAGASYDPEGGELEFEFRVGTGVASGPRSRSPVFERSVDVPLSDVVPVTVVARDARGNETAVTRGVSVVGYDHPPAAALALTAGAAPGEVVLDASASSDPDRGESWDGLLHYRFDFEGDGVFDTPFAPLARRTFVYAPERAYAPVVEVRDRLSATARASEVLELRTLPVFPQGVGLEAQAGECGVALAWSAATTPAGPVTYAVYRADLDAGGDWVEVALVARPGWVDRAAQGGRRYSYLVRAWAPGEPPLEDGNGETATVAVEESALRLAAADLGPGGTLLAWSGGEAEVWSTRDRTGAGEESLGIDSGSLVVPAAGGPGVTFYRLSPAGCDPAAVASR